MINRSHYHSRTSLSVRWQMVREGVWFKPWSTCEMMIINWYTFFSLSSAERKTKEGRVFPLDGSQIETVQRQYNYLKGKSKSLVKWTKLVFHNSEEKTWSWFLPFQRNSRMETSRQLHAFLGLWVQSCPSMNSKMVKIMPAFLTTSSVHWPGYIFEKDKGNDDIIPFYVESEMDWMILLWIRYCHSTINHSVIVCYTPCFGLVHNSILCH